MGGGCGSIGCYGSYDLRRMRCLLDAVGFAVLAVGTGWEVLLYELALHICIAPSIIFLTSV